ncbi:SMI1/KNR4 family protein [Rhizosphaericola mali]|uniref:SMI1/KNR4 family protein n=1 Tax=Rhizosphaericola mali TaxID=2545455 RepID=A0A5P2G2P7_9BACT|nr:SMI1/KNR4 family protein [Rhizosphaericola mali]QES87373.1 SMI1/KNR4 family protein [Rhizosphaericola mali]
MTPTEKLKLIMAEQYVSEDGDEYKVELKEGLTDQQIDELAKALPTGQISTEIIALLKFASGFEFYGLEEVTFDGIGQFGFEDFFPNSVQLAGDGFGNYWILDVDKNGNWGNVFYVCHDPAVIVKHSDNLTQFIEHVNDFGKNGNSSNLDIIHEKVVFDIWQKDNGFIELDSARQSNDTTLKNFALSLPDNFVIADLRNKPIRSGFAWGKFGPNIDEAKRHETELIWGIEKLEKKGFLSKLFGRR